MQNKIEVDGKVFESGYIEQSEDPRDLIFGNQGPFDWEMGFDIEMLIAYRALCKDMDEFFGSQGIAGWGVDRYKEIKEFMIGKDSFSTPVKNQGVSPSCTGQGDTYYVQVLNFVETGEWVEISARDVYAFIAYGLGKGATLRDAMKLNKNRGVATEELVPCYHLINMDYGLVKNPYNSAEYFEKPESTPEIEASRKKYQSKEFRNQAYKVDMDTMAWQMLYGMGAYFAVNGTNNKTWHSEYPQPPKKGDSIWGHALYAGKAGIDADGEPFIGLINSWGKNIGKNGWQKLKSDYFTTRNVISPYTLIDKENQNINNEIMTNAKLVRNTAGDGKEHGIYLPIYSEDALISMFGNYGLPVPKTGNGKVDWDSLKPDGETNIE